MERLAQMMELLASLSKRFPDVELRLTLQDGQITLAIPKGARGDAFAAAWGNPEHLYFIPTADAEHN